MQACAIHSLWTRRLAPTFRGLRFRAVLLVLYENLAVAIADCSLPSCTNKRAAFKISSRERPFALPQNRVRRVLALLMTAAGAHVRNNAISVMRSSRWESSESMLRESLRGMGKPRPQS